MKRTTPLKRTPFKKKPTFREWTCKHCGTSNGGGTKKMTTCVDCKIRRTTKRTSLKARCDALARELCRRLADEKCARCGGPGSDWAHRFPRRFHALRWSMLNCDFLCRPCHVFFTDHPATFISWLTVKIGTQTVEELEKIANSTWNKDYLEVINYLESFK